MKCSFLVQIDTDEMEYHAEFDAQAFADKFMTTAQEVAKSQKLGVLDIEVNYLGSN